MHWLAVYEDFMYYIWWFIAEYKVLANVHVLLIIVHIAQIYLYDWYVFVSCTSEFEII